MARVTVEDCVEKVPNRFNLILLAAHRARSISAGAALLIDRDRDKNPVVALREIADEALQPEDLRESLIQGLQKVAPVEENEAEVDRLALTHHTPEETSEEAMLRALQADRDGSPEPRG